MPLILCRGLSDLHTNSNRKNSYTDLNQTGFNNLIRINIHMRSPLLQLTQNKHSIQKKPANNFKQNIKPIKQHNSNKTNTIK